MQTILLFVLGAILYVLAVLIGPALGALAANIVAWPFPVTMYKLTQITGLDVTELGAALGFVGGFFRSVQWNKGS